MTIGDTRFDDSGSNLDDSSFDDGGSDFGDAVPVADDDGSFA